MCIRDSFSKDMRRALQLVQKFTERGIPATTIYVEILAESCLLYTSPFHKIQVFIIKFYKIRITPDMRKDDQIPLLKAPYKS